MQVEESGSLAFPGVSELIPQRGLYILAGVLIFLLLVGSFFDYAISEALFDPGNRFGMFFATYGETPALVTLASAGTLLIRGRKTRPRWIAALQLAAGGMLIAVSLLAVTVLPGAHSEVGLPLRILVGTALVAAVVGVSAVVGRGASAEVLVRVAVAMLLVVFLELVIVTAMKLIWERPRMRLLVAEPGAAYQPWWAPGYPGSGALIESGIRAEEFKSYPSGHTANAATLMLLTAFGVLSSRALRNSGWLFAIGAAWGLLVGFSRIVAGAHFLTDTVSGFAITLTILILTYRFVFRPNRRSIPPQERKGTDA